MKIYHDIVTRFATIHDAVGTPPSDEWIRTRLELFERYTLPAMQAQTEADWRWILLVHKDFDLNVWPRLRSLDKRILVAHEDATGNAHIAPPNADLLISSRLDNDDLLSKGFCESVRSVSGTPAESYMLPFLFNVPSGYRLDIRQAPAVYRVREYARHTPFLSLTQIVTPAVSCLDVYRFAHTDMYQHYREHQLLNPAWMQVVHDHNLSNRIHGDDKAIALQEATEMFPSLQNLQYK